MEKTGFSSSLNFICGETARSNLLQKMQCSLLLLLVFGVTVAWPSQVGKIYFGNSGQQSVGIPDKIQYFLLEDASLGPEVSPTDELRRTQRSFWQNLFKSTGLNGIFGDPSYANCCPNNGGNNDYNTGAAGPQSTNPQNAAPYQQQQPFQLFQPLLPLQPPQPLPPFQPLRAFQPFMNGRLGFNGFCNNCNGPPGGNYGPNQDYNSPPYIGNSAPPNNEGANLEEPGSDYGSSPTVSDNNDYKEDSGGKPTDNSDSNVTSDQYGESKNDSGYDLTTGDGVNSDPGEYKDDSAANGGGSDYADTKNGAPKLDSESYTDELNSTYNGVAEKNTEAAIENYNLPSSASYPSAHTPTYDSEQTYGSMSAIPTSPSVGAGTYTNGATSYSRGGLDERNKQPQILYQPIIYVSPQYLALAGHKTVPAQIPYEMETQGSENPMDQYPSYEEVKTKTPELPPVAEAAVPPATQPEVQYESHPQPPPSVQYESKQTQPPAQYEPQPPPQNVHQYDPKQQQPEVQYAPQPPPPNTQYESKQQQPEVQYEPQPSPPNTQYESKQQQPEVQYAPQPTPPPSTQYESKQPAPGQVLTQPSAPAPANDISAPIPCYPQPVYSIFPLGVSYYGIGPVLSPYQSSPCHSCNHMQPPAPTYENRLDPYVQSESPHSPEITTLSTSYTRIAPSGNKTPPLSEPSYGSRRIYRSNFPQSAALQNSANSMLKYEVTPTYLSSRAPTTHSTPLPLPLPPTPLTVVNDPKPSPVAVETPDPQLTSLPPHPASQMSYPDNIASRASPPKPMYSTPLIHAVPLPHTPTLPLTLADQPYRDCPELFTEYQQQQMAQHVDCIRRQSRNTYINSHIITY